MKYPEHEKLSKIKDESQSIGEFMEWLEGEKEMHLGTYHKHDERCINPEWHDDVNKGKDPIFSEEEWVDKFMCGCQENELVPIHYDVQKLLAEFFGIDLDKLEKEKRAMLDELQKAG